MTLTVNYHKIKTSKELTEYRTAVEIDIADSMALTSVSDNTRRTGASQSAFTNFKHRWRHSSLNYRCSIMSSRLTVAFQKLKSSMHDCEVIAFYWPLAAKKKSNGKVGQFFPALSNSALQVTPCCPVFFPLIMSKLTYKFSGSEVNLNLCEL